ncbi:type I-E CRISPR-associated protein Cse1/CasA [Candidatus Poriferisodalis sp.]|uniref:type I-E CRISPR-associated protein Cse1/CasA n=1 Tax=Candidatus Poriferisodalis sp. TaxID=3101277 RepID=UPI003B02792F
MTGKGFNLITDPWIPVDGGPISIEEALVNAHQIDGWPCSDPAFSEALMRLLVPMTYRITGMDDHDHELYRCEFADRQRRLLDEGRLDPECVRSYLDQHRDRFWLVNPPAGHEPIAQDSALSRIECPDKPAKAVFAWASTSSPSLGPHAATDMIEPGIAAQALLTLRLFYGCGTVTGHPATGKPRGNGKNPPLRNTTSLHPVGKNLAATLIAHMIPKPHDTVFGEAFWETESVPGQIAPYARRAGMLEQIAGRQDKTFYWHTTNGCITGFTLAAGRGTAPDLAIEDPYTLVRDDQSPIRPREGREFWREAQSLLLKSGDDQYARVPILDWARDGDSSAENYPPSEFGWVAFSHRGERSKPVERASVCAHAPDLLGIFQPDASRRCTTFLALAADAERLMCDEVKSAFRKAGVITRKSKAEEIAEVRKPARSAYWHRAEADFWQVARDVVDDEHLGERLREHALIGFDDATAHLMHERRSHLAVVESRRWIERWRRQSNGSTDRGDVTV